MHAFETMLKDKCGFNGTQPYWNWSLNTEDFFNSKIFDPSRISGFGGNGDPNNDYEITNGGFSTDFPLAYPVPHNLRRNFTLKPWQGRPSVFADHTAPPIDPEKMANTSFSKAEVQKLVEGFRGDFEGFQAYFEAFQVRLFVCSSIH
jgi:tyrosinase